MKNLCALLLILIFVSGCQKSDDPKTSFKSSKPNLSNNFVAEGMNHLGNSNVTEAIASFDAAIKQDPANINNYLILGEVYLRLNQFPRAEDTFSAATKLDPSSGDAYLLLAKAQALQEGKRSDAVSAAKKSAELYLAQNQPEDFRRAVAVVQSLTSEVQAVKTE